MADNSGFEVPFIDEGWEAVERPGYFGRKRDAIVRTYNETYGPENWTFGWKWYGQYHPFTAACAYFYERSYYQYFKKNKDDLLWVMSFYEVIDNGEANIQSGLDYNRQEQPSTHIQDIAIRNCIHKFRGSFNKNSTEILTVRGPKTNGFKLNPGNIPFFVPEQIEGPKVSPDWALPGSVEDFWQNNKWLMVRKDTGILK